MHLPDRSPRLLAAFTAVAALVLALPALAAQITDVRVGAHPTFTRIVFELDSRAGYQVERSGTDAAPEIRITIDAVSSARSLRAAGDVRGVKVDAGTKARAHIALRQPGLRVREMMLSDPPRIVIDFVKSETAIAAGGEAAKPKSGAKETAKPAPKQTAKAEPKEAPKTEPKPIAKVEPKPALKPEPVQTAKAEPKEAPPAPKETATPKPAPVSTTPAPVVPPPVAPKTAAATPPPPPKEAAPAPATPPAITPAPRPTSPPPAPAQTTAKPVPPAIEPPPKPTPDTEHAHVTPAAPAPVAPPPAPIPPAPAPTPVSVRRPEPEPMPSSPPAPPAPTPAPALPTPSPAPGPHAAPQPTPTPAPASGASWTDHLRDPIWLGGIAAAAAVLGLAAIGIAMRRRRALPNDLDVTAIAEEVAQTSESRIPSGGFAMGDDDHASEPAESTLAGLFDAPAEKSAPARPEFPVRPPSMAPPAPIPASGAASAAADDSLFDVAGEMSGEPDASEGDAPMDQEMDLPAARTQTQAAPAARMGGSAAPAASSPDIARMLQEMERRIATLEARLDESNEAREKLERQVAAQSEELRVQRAAIARTQRALRTMTRGDEDKATEPALRDGDTQARTRVTP